MNLKNKVYEIVESFGPSGLEKLEFQHMTEITLKVTDESLLPMLRKLFRSMEGVEMVTHRRKKNGVEKALDDVKAGRVYVAANGEDLIRQCLND